MVYARLGEDNTSGGGGCSRVASCVPSKEHAQSQAVSLAYRSSCWPSSCGQKRGARKGVTRTRGRQLLVLPEPQTPRIVGR